MSLDQPAEFVKHQTVTRDAFLGGRLTLSQPRQGFRAGLDSVLLGASVPKNSKRLVDLGAGVGTAGLVALANGLVESAVLAEIDAQTLLLTQENIVSNGLADRAQAIEVDVTAPAATRRDKGLSDNSFDVVIANPPFFTAGNGTLAKNNARATARHMPEPNLDQWVRSAAAAAKAGGTAIFIFPVAGLQPLLSSFSARFGAITVLPLPPRANAPATRVLIRGIKGSKAPLTLLAGRALHGADGRQFAEEFDAIFRGKACLDW